MDSPTPPVLELQVSVRASLAPYEALFCTQLEADAQAVLRIPVDRLYAALAQQDDKGRERIWRLVAGDVLGADVLDADLPTLLNLLEGHWRWAEADPHPDFYTGPEWQQRHVLGRAMLKLVRLACSELRA